MSRCAAACLVVGLLAAATAAAATPETAVLAECAAGTAADRTDCSRTLLEPLAPRDRAAALHRMADAHPVLTVELARSVPTELVPSEPVARAAWLDAEATALAGAGLTSDAVRRFAESLALDDGTVRLSWFESGRPGVAWSAAIGPGLARHRRAAAVAVAAGDAERAAAWRTIADGLSVPDGSSLPATATLSAPPWRVRMPAIEYDVMQGGRGRVGGPGGRVTLIDFWATWCAPCIEELPHLVELRDRMADAGLDLVLVNVGESREVALPFVRGLGIDAPIAAYNPEFDAEIDADTLPTLVLVDRDGAMRGRWNGYRNGLIAEIEPIVRHVLDERPTDGDPAAHAALGAGTFRLDWYREVSGRIEDLAALPAADGSVGLMAGLGRRLALYRADGGTVREIEGLPMSTALVAAPPGDAGTTAVLGFRPGARHLVVIDLGNESATPVEFDAALLDAAAADPSATRLVVAGLGGLTLVEGDVVRPIASGTVSDVEPSGAGFRLLEAGLRSLRLAAVDAEPDDEREVPADAWRLVAGPNGFGTLPVGVADATIGRFLPGSGPAVAAVATDGTLTVVRSEDGEVVFRATWPGLMRVAAVDVDGDGVQELAVATADRLGLLRAIARDEPRPVALDGSGDPR